MEKDNIIAIISDETIGLEKKYINDDCIVRYASRGIIVDENGNIAIFHKKNKNEYKLPGGGIKKNETPTDAFIREVYEEAGCDVRITEYLGIVIEEKGLTNFKQISHVFVAKVINNTGILHLTLKEQNEGACIMWKSLDNAIELINKCTNELVGSEYDDLYRSLFMVKRDSEILSYYKNKFSIRCDNYLK